MHENKEPRHDIEKLITAYCSLAKAISAFTEHPDLSTKNDAQFNEFLENNDFTSAEKHMLKTENNKNKAYRKIIKAREHQEACVIFTEFHKFFDHSKHFLNAEAKKQFEKVDSTIWHNWISKHT